MVDHEVIPRRLKALKLRSEATVCINRVGGFQGRLHATVVGLCLAFDDLFELSFCLFCDTLNFFFVLNLHLPQQLRMLAVERG
jgi:hypothetical protein